jgi:hypothetical protein
MSVSPNNAIKLAIDQRARSVPASKRARYRAAAYETAQVESGFTNPSSGDADSEGWRQERASLYPDPTNIPHSVDRFFRELAQQDRGQPSYELAADVQRPAAQYRDRYRTAQPLALQLLHSGGGSARAGTRPAAIAPAAAPITTTSDQPTFDQAGYEQAQRKQLLATFLQHNHRGNSVLFRSGLLSSKPVDATTFQGTRTVTTTSPGGLELGGTGLDSGGVRSAVDAARKQLGAITENTGSNRGTRLDKLEARYGMVGQPWCGMFAGMVLRQAGVRGVGPWIASVAEIEAKARAGGGPFAGWTSGAHARPGDLVIPAEASMSRSWRASIATGRLHVISGNTGNGAVTTGTWRPDQVYGVARPKYR